MSLPRIFSKISEYLEMADGLPPATDFHQRIERLLFLCRQGIESRLLTVGEGHRTDLSAVFEKSADTWYLWKGPSGSPEEFAFASFLIAAKSLGKVALVLSPQWESYRDFERFGYVADGVFRTLLVPTASSPDGLLGQMADASRRCVKKALRSGLEFLVGPQYLGDFYPVYSASMTSARSPDFATYAELEALLVVPGVHLFVAAIDKRIIAGSVSFRNPDSLEARYVATHPEYRHLCPLHFVHYHCMIWCREHEIPHLDLSGLSLDESDPKLKSINRFKTGFGGQALDYPILLHAGRQEIGSGQ